MNPSSLDIDLSVVQRQKDMYKWFDSELTEDEGSPNLPKIMGWGNKLPVVKTVFMLLNINHLNKWFIPVKRIIQFLPLYFVIVSCSAPKQSQENEPVQVSGIYAGQLLMM